MRLLYCPSRSFVNITPMVSLGCVGLWNLFSVWNLDRNQVRDALTS